MTVNKHGGRTAGKRQLRVGEEIRHALAGILMRGELHDPDLENVSVTVTAVDVSPDLRNATAYVTPLGGTHQAEVVAGLNRCAKWLRGQVAGQVRLKFAPNITFRLDQSFDQAERVEALLRAPSVAADLADPDGEGAADRFSDHESST